MAWRTSVRERRKEKGWSQRKTARLMGISQATLSRVENGVDEPGMMFTLGLQRAFPEVRPELLFWWEEDAEPVPAEGATA